MKHPLYRNRPYPWRLGIGPVLVRAEPDGSYRGPDLLCGRESEVEDVQFAAVGGNDAVAVIPFLGAVRVESVRRPLPRVENGDVVTGLSFHLPKFVLQNAVERVNGRVFLGSGVEDDTRIVAELTGPLDHGDDLSGDRLAVLRTPREGRLDSGQRFSVESNRLDGNRRSLGRSRGFGRSRSLVRLDRCGCRASSHDVYFLFVADGYREVQDSPDSSRLGVLSDGIRPISVRVLAVSDVVTDVLHFCVTVRVAC